MFYRILSILLFVMFNKPCSYSQINKKIFNGSDSATSKINPDTTKDVTQFEEEFYEVKYSNVIKGDRIIIKKHLFKSNLPKANIQLKIKVYPEGKGIILDFDRGSTSNDSSYLKVLKLNLPYIVFNNSDHESIITVLFHFKGL